MQNGPKTIMNVRRPSPASFAARSKRSEPKGSQNAQRNYERYLALARAEALTGDRQRPTTSTPNIISDRCPRTRERNRRLAATARLRSGRCGCRLSIA